jgi:hypothetical protein
MARNHFFKSLKGTSLIPGGSGAGQGAVSADLVDADDLLSSGEVKAAIFHPFLYTHLHKPDEQRSAPGLVYRVVLVFIHSGRGGAARTRPPPYPVHWLAP